MSARPTLSAQSAERGDDRMGIQCPRCQKISADSDFCSECGTPIVMADPMAQHSTAVASDHDDPPRDQFSASAPAVCPACGEPRDTADSRYCNNCRYDFLTNTSYAEEEVAAEHGDHDHGEPLVE